MTFVPKLGSSPFCSRKRNVASASARKRRSNKLGSVLTIRLIVLGRRRPRREARRPAKLYARRGQKVLLELSKNMGGSGTNQFRNNTICNRTIKKGCYYPFSIHA